MTSWNIIILIAIITAVTGLIAGVLIMLLVGDRRKSRTAPAPDESRSTLFKEVTRLWRDRANGRLMVEVDGKLLADGQALSDTQRAELAAATRDMLKWLGMPAATGVTIPASKASTPPPIPETRPIPTPPLAAPTVPSAKTPEIARPLSMVEQIDAILQEKVAAASLADKSLRLTEEPTHGVVVWMGLQRYVGIDAVPDPQAVALIREAVAEWEQQATTGRV